VRILRALIVLLVALWLVGEIVAIPVADHLIEQQVSARTNNVAAVHARVGSFPVVARYVVTGKVKTVSVTLDRVTRVALTFATIRFDLSGVSIDRSALLKGKGRITAIDRGTITATIDVGALRARVARFVESDVRVSGRTLVIGPESFRLSSDVLPCDPSERIEGDRIILSCTINEVPPALLEEAQR